MHRSELSVDLIESFREGMVIPAMPLALKSDRSFDERHQRALLRYYIDAGVGGVAVGVHSTQFEIRDPNIKLFEPVLSFASRTIDEHAQKRGRRILKIAGVCGRTHQAVSEATFARSVGYHACLLSLSALKNDSVDALVEHCKAVSQVMPLIGFYLQPSVGGRILPYSFWRRFAEIENVLGIKIAPFNRYQTFDVVRAVCDASRDGDITLYTGNDDNIVLDLLTEYRVGERRIRIKGGLLGHWCVWTRKAVELLDEIHSIVKLKQSISPSLLTRATEITDSNAAFFDAANSFAGCIPGLHEVLRRQGVFEGTWCLNTNDTLSPGQKEEIDRVYAAYPGLNDDAFVQDNLAHWLT